MSGGPAPLTDDKLKRDRLLYKRCRAQIDVLLT